MPPPDTAAAAASHAPIRGLSHRLLGRFHVTGVFWYRLHDFGARSLSPFWLHFVMVGFTSFFFLLVLGRSGARSPTT
ncbi:MAG: hypothetical protein R2712_20605 [Vicinamibacterales bacterium]